jgi:hypothetical protein
LLYVEKKQEGGIKQKEGKMTQSSFKLYSQSGIQLSKILGQAWWYMPVIPAPPEVETGLQSGQRPAQAKVEDPI